MVETNLSSKYGLRPEQIQALFDAGKEKSTTWWVKNLTKNEFVNYTSILGIERVKGDTPLNITFPEGTFEVGTELKAAVGVWDVCTEDGRHCLQSAFFYINEDGKAVPCKYKELPSQNNGVVPQVPEGEQSQTTAPAQQASTQSTTVQQQVPVVQAAVTGYTVHKNHVLCTKYADVYKASDSCTDYMSDDSGLSDMMCESCRNHVPLYVREDDS